MSTTKNAIIVYAEGICRMSVCAAKDLTVEEIEHGVNLSHPTGIGSSWKVSEDKTFKGGQPNPCPCNDHPDERLHYLMNC